MLGLQKLLLPVGALFLAGAAACVATRNRDGSVTLEFSPDMTITAWGLENALNDLTDLLAKCLLGTFQRPCTQAEMEDVLDAIEEVLERKERMGGANPPGFGPPRVM